LIYSLYKNEYRNLKPAETTIRKGIKKYRRDKPIGVIIRMYMELSQGNYLCNYLYLQQAKMSCFAFYFFLFFFYKIVELEGRTGTARGGVGTSGRGELAGKEDRRVQKMCTHACKCKNDTC
jgi:hypothetical protein